MLRALVLLTLAGCLSLPSALAQERPVDDDEEVGGGLTSVDEERLYDEIVARLQREAVQLTALVQVVPIVGIDDAGPSRFTLPRARLGVRTRLDGGFGARLQAELARSPALLDAYVSYHSQRVTVDVGRHNAPFGFETLTSAASTDFVRRSLAERAISPGRTLGVSGRVRVTDALAVRGGVFNPVFDDPRTGAEADPEARGGVLFAGRAQATLGDDDRGLILGASGGAETVGVRTPDANGASGRFIWGADARAHIGRLVLGGEVLGWTLAQDAPFTPSPLVGGHLTAGVDLTARQRTLVRLDGLDESLQVWVGHNVSFTRAASLQANVVVPVNDDALGAQVLVNAQIAF